MTCVVAIASEGKVYIGADSAGVAGLDLMVRSDRKVFVKEGYAFGFCGSFRMGQLLAHSLRPPFPRPDDDLMQFMVTDFVDGVRSCLKAGGYAARVHEVESAGFFLVGYRGRLFQIESDYQVGETPYGFDAIGCGGAFALGALHATPEMPPEPRILNALAIAEKCSAGVRGPFHVVRAFNPDSPF